VTYKDLAALLETIMASPLITAKQDNGTNDQVPSQPKLKGHRREINFYEKNERSTCGPGMFISDPEFNNTTKEEGGKIVFLPVATNFTKF
jgi:hypothetical protein